MPHWSTGFQPDHAAGLLLCLVLEVADLPLVAVEPAAGKSTSTVAIMLSGDGGWAGLDQAVGKVIAAQGIPVVGYDSLRYHWRRRTPAGANEVDCAARWASF